MNRLIHLFKKKIIKIIEILLWPFISLFVLYYLYKNNKIFNNKIIFLSWHWSFGHQSIMLDSCAKLFKKKISLISILYSKRTNLYLSKIYHKYYDEKILIRSNHALICHFFYKSTLLILKIIIFFNKKNKLITYDDIRNQQIKESSLPIKFYNESKNIIEIHHDNLHWYDKLPNKKLDLSLPEDLSSECINILEKNNCFIKKKKIVNLFFRDYQNKNLEMSAKNYFDLLRMNYKPKNYIKAILWLARKNYIIFIHCSNKIKDFDVIKHPNIFIVSNFRNIINPELLNIFLITVGSIHISQNSGSVFPAFSLKKKVIICDMFPFSNGLSGKCSILFPKLLIDKKLLNFEKYINTDFFYGKGFDNVKNKILPNDEIDILKIVKNYNKKQFNRIKFNNDSGIYYRTRINNIFYYK